MTKTKKLLTTTLLCLLMLTCCFFGIKIQKASAATNTDYMERMQDLTYTAVIDGEEVTMKYRLYVPENYDASKNYPLVTMLHGHGGQGDDNTTQINVFKPLLTKLTTLEQLDSDPAILFVPQCRINHKWVEVTTWTGHYSIEDFPISRDLQAVVNITEQLMADYAVDDDRMYITGHSMGGLATWDMLGRYPNRYAAALPIAGAGNDPTIAESIKNVNIWAAHNTEDKVVGVDVTRTMVEALQKVNGNIKYTETTDTAVGHSNGTVTYRDYDVVDFLFCSTKGQANKYFTDKQDFVPVNTFSTSGEYSFVNNVTKTDYDGILRTNFDALSVNFPSTTTVRSSGLHFNFAQSLSTTSEKAIRLRIQTVVPATGRESWWFGISSEGNKTAYIAKSETNSTTHVWRKGVDGVKNVEAKMGSDTKGLTCYVLDSKDIAGNKMTDSYISIPLSQFTLGDEIDLTKLTGVVAYTDPQYAKNIWNFGDIELGTLSATGEFTKEQTIWTPFTEQGEGAYTTTNGVTAKILRAGTSYNTTTAKGSYIKSEFVKGSTAKVDISKYDGIMLTVNNTASAAVNMQVYMWNGEVAEANANTASYGWCTKNGLATFIPDEDCTAYKNSFSIRSQLIPAGFKGRMYIPFKVNGVTTADNITGDDSGAWEARSANSLGFPTEVYNSFQIYLNNLANAGFTISDISLVSEDTSYVNEAFESVANVNLTMDESKAIMVQGEENLAAQFEFWTNNKTTLQFAECNQTNEDIKNGSALAVRIRNLNNQPFVFSLITWNKYADMVLLGGDTPDADVKLVNADGTVQNLTMSYGHIIIPANADGTLVISYTGGLECSTSKGQAINENSYFLGYPVKGIFRLVFNIFDRNGEVAMLLGDIAVVKDDGSYTLLTVGDDTNGYKSMAEAALGSADGEYKKERGYIAYSGALKTFTVAVETREGATLSVNNASVAYGSKAIFTVNGLSAGDSVKEAYLNGINVTEKLTNESGVYTLEAVAKENLTFSVVLDSDPEYFDVSVECGTHGSVEYGETEILEGSNFLLTVAPANGYEVASILVNNVEKKGELSENTLTVAISADTSIVVSFAEKEYAITYVLDGGENVSANPATYTILDDEIVLVAATKANYEFLGWYNGDMQVESIAAGSYGDITLTAKWKLVSYAISYQFNANQGSISPAPMEAEYGEALTLTVTAKDGYSVKKVLVNDVETALVDGKLSVTVNGATAIKVEFEQVVTTDSSSSSDTEENGGCKSTMSLGGVFVAMAFAVFAVSLKKRKED